MLSTIVLSTISILQNIQFQYLYFALGLYILLIWICLGLWLWKDSDKRFRNGGARFVVWLLTFITFIPGLLLYILARPNKKDDDTSWSEMERAYLKYETYGIGKCTQCNYDLRPEFFFCPSCGKELRKKCESCSNVVDVEWSICPFCADAKINREEQQALPSGKEKVGGAIWEIFKGEFKFYQKLRELNLKLDLFQKDSNKKRKIEKSKDRKILQNSMKELSSNLQQFKKLIFIEEKITPKKD